MWDSGSTIPEYPVNASFYVWNVSFTYDVNKTVQIYGRADNIFNRKYEEVLFFGTPIRSVFGGVRSQF